MTRRPIHSRNRPRWSRAPLDWSARRALTQRVDTACPRCGAAPEQAEHFTRPEFESGVPVTRQWAECGGCQRRARVSQWNEADSEGSETC